MGKLHNEGVENMLERDIKKSILEKAFSLGANLVRSCSVEKWREFPLQEERFWPQNIWPWVKNVVVLGIPLYAPMISTSPSMVYQELYDTSNRVLDDMAYHLTNFISTQLGYRALFFPRDCYYNIEVLLQDPSAAFSHVIAAYYAGMGTIGDSHNLITPEFGPRLRIVSILTDAPIPPDEMLKKNLCIHCKKCMYSCPSHCFSENGERLYHMDKIACTKYHVQLKAEHHWPCGICVSVCPVGADLQKYRGGPIVSLEGKVHCQRYGS